MARGGKREGAGRKRGSTNRRSRRSYEAAAQSGILPLPYMLEVMRDESQPDERRDKMAVAAAPFLHARLSPVEVEEPEPSVDLSKLSDEQLEHAIRLRRQLDACLAGTFEGGAAAEDGGADLLETVGDKEDDTRH